MSSPSSVKTASNPAQELAEFITELSYDELPDRSIRIAERCFVDTLGVAIAGASAAAGTIAKDTYDSLYSPGPATIIGTNSSLPEPEAAFVNGTASHALDYDDVSTGMDGHPSPPLVAPILSLTESLDRSGKDMLTAYVAGFETLCYVAAPNLRGRTGPGAHERGWHPTAIFGTFGATAAASHLLDLTPNQTQQALNIAASMAAGLKRNFGSLSKPMHAGQAGAAGIRAARLAENGFTAIDDALLTGFFPVYLGVEDLDESVLYSLGDRWALLEDGVDIKKYPACYATHTTILAAQELVAKHKITPAEIANVHVTINSQMKDLLVHDNPETEAQAKFSIPYTTASAIVFDYIGIETFEPDTITDDSVQGIRRLVEYELDESLPPQSTESTVTVELEDGTQLSNTIDTPPATHENPLSETELREKFIECATRTIDTKAAEQCFDHVNSLREITDVSTVTQFLSP